jgi:hypothetical protein
MQRGDAELAELAATQHGVVTIEQARAAGLSIAQMKQRCRTGLLVPVHRGVYRHAAGEDSAATALLAACLAGGPHRRGLAPECGAAVAPAKVPRWRPEITVPGTRLPRLAGVVVHRTDRLDAEDVGLVEGTPVTSVARTVLDLGSVLHVDPFRTAVEDAVLRRLTTPLDLVCILERLGGPGRRGAAHLRAVVAGLVPAPVLESRLEAALLRLIRASGAPPPTTQHEVVVARGRRVRFDFAWPQRRVAVEADGRRWHATSADFERDLARHNAVTAAGWRLYRYGWADVHRRRDRTLADIAGALSTAGAA